MPAIVLFFTTELAFSDIVGAASAAKKAGLFAAEAAPTD